MSKRKRHYGGKHVGAGKSDVQLPERKRNPRLRKPATRQKAWQTPRFLFWLLVALSGIVTGTVIALTIYGVRVLIDGIEFSS